VAVCAEPEMHQVEKADAAGLQVTAQAAVTAGTPASRARASIRRARAIFVANLTCSGIPAAAQRAASSVQQRGR
jgi:hypothetical protein